MFGVRFVFFFQSLARFFSSFDSCAWTCTRLFPSMNFLFGIFCWFLLASMSAYVNYRFELIYGFWSIAFSEISMCERTLLFVFHRNEAQAHTKTANRKYSHECDRNACVANEINSIECVCVQMEPRRKIGIASFAARTKFRCESSLWEIIIFLIALTCCDKEARHFEILICVKSKQIIQKWNKNETKRQTMWRMRKNLIWHLIICRKCVLCLATTSTNIAVT